MSIATVVGSTNIDLVIKTPRFLKAGETVKRSDPRIFHSGKGVNQVFAGSRLGLEANFITKIGRNDFGKKALKNFQAEGTKSDYLIIDDNLLTSSTFVEVDDQAQN